MILRQAVTHIPLSQYAFANTETNLTFRLRAAKENLSRCVLWYGDRVQPGDPIRFEPLEMERVATDLWFDYYEVTFETPYSRVCYYFELADAQEMLFLYADLFSPALPKERSEFYQYPFVRREELSTVPAWLKKAVVYNIFPDSFATGKRSLCQNSAEMEWKPGLPLKSRLGGTITGITENLDYIAELGFTCIYINPIFTAGEYHKYDLLDYLHVSPNMGTDEGFRALVDTAHGMGLRVVIDGVFNHCSWYFFAFDDVVKNGENSRYKDWFYDLQYPVLRPADEQECPDYACFAYERKMPKLNSSNPEVRAYFMNVCDHWIREFHVDGWRLDVANEVDRGFWREFKQVSRAANPESVMIGEIWESAESWLRGDMFDSTMNYDFRKNCRDFFGQGRISAAEFHVRVNQMNFRYPTGILQGQLNLLDSHDVNRFYTYCQNDMRRFRLAEVFLFTAPGVPCVFYGDELGMQGDSEFTLRGPMPWGKPISDEREFFKTLIKLRRENNALAEGSYQLLAADNNGLYAFVRRLGNKAVTVALNASAEKAAFISDENPGSLACACAYNGSELGAFGYAVWEK